MRQPGSKILVRHLTISDRCPPRAGIAPRLSVVARLTPWVAAVALAVTACGSGDADESAGEASRPIADGQFFGTDRDTGRDDGSGRSASVECTTTIDGPDDSDQLAASHGLPLSAALADSLPGDTVCVVGGSYERISVDTSGSVEAPITIRGLRRATTEGFDVTANHVRVAGFTITGGTGDAPGIELQGQGIEIVDNVIVGPSGHGIACQRGSATCEDVLIAGNSISGVDGSGIVVFGVRVTVRDNEITGSVRRKASDADGIRFFGSDHVISGNRIHEIFDRGYANGDGPHTDCFQTFDESDTPSRDVLIEGNVCQDVDHQCLIATSTASREDGEIGRSRGIRFVNNVCDTNGSQAVLISEFPDVLVANNVFMANIESRAIIALESSTGLRVLNNLMLGSYVPYELSEDSRAGFIADHNLQHGADLGTPPSGWAEPSGLWGKDPLLENVEIGEATFGYDVRAGSPIIDGGADIEGLTLDALGKSRPVDGDGDGRARVDIGPIEFRPQ